MSYRLLEHVVAGWTCRPWAQVAQHTLPPLGMLGLGIALWRRVPPLPGTRARRPLGSVGLSVAVGMLLGGLVGLVNLLLMLAVRNKGGAGVASLDPGAAALVAHIVLLAPVAEEVAFRGLIYRIFRQSMVPLTATLISAVIFGMMHVQPDKAVWAFMLGIVAATAYEQTRSLLTPILVHALFNAVPVGVAVLRAKPDDTGPIWLVLALAAVVFSISARSARRTSGH